ncbi:unnamed protein product, partial [Onchocerca ochengi]
IKDGKIKDNDQKLKKKIDEKEEFIALRTRSATKRRIPMYLKNGITKKSQKKTSHPSKLPNILEDSMNTSNKIQ